MWMHLTSLYNYYVKWNRFTGRSPKTWRGMKAARQNRFTSNPPQVYVLFVTILLPNIHNHCVPFSHLFSK